MSVIPRHRPLDSVVTECGPCRCPPPTSLAPSRDSTQLPEQNGGASKTRPNRTAAAVAGPQSRSSPYPWDRRPAATRVAWVMTEFCLTTPTPKAVVGRERGLVAHEPPRWQRHPWKSVQSHWQNAPSLAREHGLSRSRADRGAGRDAVGSDAVFGLQPALSSAIDDRRHIHQDRIDGPDPAAFVRRRRCRPATGVDQDCLVGCG
jgi:hypothetical protein